MISPRWRRALAYPVGVAIVLLAMDQLVRGPFIDDFMLPRYRVADGLLRERTTYRNTRELMDLLVHTRQERAVTIAVIGDSTLKGDLHDPESALVASLLRRALRRQFPWIKLEVVEAANYGLNAIDAALMTDKLLGAGVDVIVYGLLQRALGRQPPAWTLTPLRAQLGASDLMRLERADAIGWLLRNTSTGDLATGLVTSTWATYAYRAPLRQFLWQATLESSAKTWPALRVLAPEMTHGPVMQPRRPTTDRLIMRDNYDYPSEAWDALEVFARLCERVPRARCVVYSGPLNPVNRDKLVVEPSFHREYVQRAAAIMARHGVDWIDLSYALDASDFGVVPPGTNIAGGMADPIHPDAAGRERLVRMLTRPIGDAVRAILAARAGAS